MIKHIIFNYVSKERKIQKWKREDQKPFRDGKTRHQLYSCSYKRAYCEDGAIKRARELNNLNNRTYLVQHYKCWYCDGFHVGRSLAFKDITRNHFVRVILSLEEQELSPREIGALLSENYGGEKKRYIEIMKRFALARTQNGGFSRFIRDEPDIITT